MKDYTEPFATPGHSLTNTAERSPSMVFPNVFLPRTIYEALPAAYMAVGTLFVAGATYIGIGHEPMVGYLAVGISCMFAGVTLSGIRRRERAK